MAASAQAPPSLLMTEPRFSNTGHRGHKKLWVNVMICTEDVANVCRHAIPRQGFVSIHLKNLKNLKLTVV